jgi:hypothetical protein
VPDAAAFVRSLFGPPGGPAANHKELLEQAAAALADLLLRACARQDPTLERSLTPIRAFLRGPAPEAEKRRLLCHPLFIEGLHTLAPFSAELRRWHDSVAPTPAGQAVPAAQASLGNVALLLLLRADRRWQGEHDLCTDVLGRIGFPFCDWSLALKTDGGDCLASRAVRLRLDHDQASWRLGDTAETPFLEMSRDDCLRMLVDNDDPCDLQRLRYPNARVKPRLQRASPLGASNIRYDPVGFQDFQAHAGLTGGLVKRLLVAIRRDSPAIYRELCTFMHTIRGFEFPPSANGVVASFSDPTLPGVMGINVSYTPRHEPRVDPFCFTWIGHELGHTKDYLNDNILYGKGQALVHNPAESVGPIPRYGRSLAVRTLIQVPYVHLYEWALLMDFWEADFRGLPWRVSGDMVALGNDLAAEIEEAFALIEGRACLTALGVTAVGHFRALFAQALTRWRSVRSRGCHCHRA